MKVKIDSIERSSGSPIVKMITNSLLREPIFWYQGLPYIVGRKELARRDNGKVLWEVQMRRIEGITTMHTHLYWNGICYLCGIFKEDE